MLASFPAPVLSVAADAVSELDGREALSGLWTLFTKCKESLQDGRRLENISWRLWYREMASSHHHAHPLVHDLYLEEDKINEKHDVIVSETPYRPPTPDDSARQLPPPDHHHPHHPRSPSTTILRSSPAPRRNSHLHDHQAPVSLGKFICDMLPNPVPPTQHPHGVASLPAPLYPPRPPLLSFHPTDPAAPSPYHSPPLSRSSSESVSSSAMNQPSTHYPLYPTISSEIRMTPEEVQVTVRDVSSLPTPAAEANETEGALRLDDPVSSRVAGSESSSEETASLAHLPTPNSLVVPPPPVNLVQPEVVFTTTPCTNTTTTPATTALTTTIPSNVSPSAEAATPTLQLPESQLTLPAQPPVQINLPPLQLQLPNTLPPRVVVVHATPNPTPHPTPPDTPTLRPQTDSQAHQTTLASQLLIPGPALRRKDVSVKTVSNGESLNGIHGLNEDDLKSVMPPLFRVPDRVGGGIGVSVRGQNEVDKEPGEERTVHPVVAPAPPPTKSPPAARRGKPGSPGAREAVVKSESPSSTKSAVGSISPTKPAGVRMGMVRTVSGGGPNRNRVARGGRLQQQQRSRSHGLVGQRVAVEQIQQSKSDQPVPVAPREERSKSGSRSRSRSRGAEGNVGLVMTRGVAKARGRVLGGRLGGLRGGTRKKTSSIVAATACEDDRDMEDDEEDEEIRGESQSHLASEFEKQRERLREREREGKRPTFNIGSNSDEGSGMGSKSAGSGSSVSAGVGVDTRVAGGGLGSIMRHTGPGFNGGAGGKGKDRDVAVEEEVEGDQKVAGTPDLPPQKANAATVPVIPPIGQTSAVDDGQATLPISGFPLPLLPLGPALALQGPRRTTIVVATSESDYETDSEDDDGEGDSWSSEAMSGADRDGQGQTQPQQHLQQQPSNSGPHRSRHSQSGGNTHGHLPPNHAQGHGYAQAHAQHGHGHGHNVSRAQQYQHQRNLTAQQALVEQAALEAQRQRDMFAKIKVASTPSVRPGGLTTESRTRSVGLLSQLMNPDPQIFPVGHPYRRGFSSGEIAGGGGFVGQGPGRERGGQGSSGYGAVRPGLQTSKSVAALPLASQVQARSGSGGVGGGGAAVTSGGGGSGSGGGGYRPKGMPQGQEMEDDSSDEEEVGGGVSKSVAQEKLKALAERRGIVAHKRTTSNGAGELRNVHYAPSQAPMPTQQQQQMPHHTTPIPLGHPYNLPPPAAPSTPRTTRRLMLQTEMSESLRRNLLWERQVSKVNLIGFRRAVSNGGAQPSNGPSAAAVAAVAGPATGAGGNTHNGAGRKGSVLGGPLRPLTTTPSMVQLSAKTGENGVGRRGSGGAEEDSREREEMKKKAMARNRSWADDYHYRGW